MIEMEMMLMMKTSIHDTDEGLYSLNIWAGLRSIISQSFNNCAQLVSDKKYAQILKKVFCQQKNHLVLNDKPESCWMQRK